MEWLEPESPGGTIKVAAARELANRLEFAPFEGKHHVVVFDPAEALTEQAYNALLKTIEEPKPGVHFVMLATGLDSLLPTILSRCMTMRLGRLGDDDVRTIIERTLQARAGTDDDPGEVAAERIDLAVRLASGSAGVGVELALDPSLEPALALLRELAKAAQAGPERIFSGDKGPLWHAWSTAVGPIKTGKPARERAVANRCAELWLLHLRECLRGGAGLPGVPTPPDRRATLHQLDRVQALLEGMSRNPNVRLALEQTLLELSA
jgi:DNA polymerase-3 subunit delta'